MPGQYTVVLTADGKSYTRPLTVQMDPRVKTPATDLAQQFRLSNQVYEDLRAVAPVMEAADSLREQLGDRKKQAAGKAETAAAIDAFEKKLEAVAGGGPPPRPGIPSTAPLTLVTVTGRLGQLFGVLQESDAAPTTQTVANVSELRAALPEIVTKWKALTAADLKELNAALGAANLPEIKVEEKPLSRIIGVDANVLRGQVAGEE
jgi:hypothetical protein